MDDIYSRAVWCLRNPSKQTTENVNFVDKPCKTTTFYILAYCVIKVDKVTVYYHLCNTIIIYIRVNIFICKRISFIWFKICYGPNIHEKSTHTHKRSLCWFNQSILLLLWPLSSKCNLVLMSLCICCVDGQT